MKYRTIIGGAFLAVTIAACSSAAAAPEPSSVAPPVRDQSYKDSAPAISADPITGISCRRQCP